MNPIVGIGEVLWDLYPDGRKVAGGAPFNFAFHCHQLGHPAVIVSRVGTDDLGRELRERVRELGLSDEYIQTDYEHPTGTVQVTLDANKVPTYTITENVAWDYIAWNEQTHELVRRCRCVCYGTLGQRSAGGWNTVQDFLCTHLHEGECFPWRVFDINFRKDQFAQGSLRPSLARAEWVKLNSDEVPRLAALLGCAITDPVAFLKQLVALTTPEQRCVIWTHGERGCDVFGFQEDIHEPGVPARVVDTVGAGDAFTAAMVCLYLEGKTLRECARFANHFAARVCEHQGATPRIDRAEVEMQAFGK
ncbi:MAG: carbohydrate kinase [Planctomycetia bacterium]|nr:carbohydrate kinase [Planctomycetia bacterium]